MKIRLLAILLIIPMLLTGCWDNTDINDLIIITTMALDKGEGNNIKVTLLCINPTPKKSTEGEKISQNNDVIFFSGEGVDIMDACNRISRKLSRKLFFSQIENILMGEYLARENAAEYLDFFARHPEPPLKTHIFLTKGEANKLFNTTSSLERNISQEIDKVKSLNLKAEVRMRDFIFCLTEEGIDPILPIIEIIDSDKDKSSQEQSIKVASIVGAGIFKKSKLVDIIDYDTYRGVLYVQDKIDTGISTVSFSKANGDGYISAKVLNSSTKITPLLKNHAIELYIEIKTKAHISENTTKLDFTKSNVIAEINDRYEQRIKNLVQKALDQVKKEDGCDVFGFGSIIRGKYSKQWDDNYKKNWDKLLPSIKVSLSCNLDITELGSDTKSIQRTEEEFLR